MPKRILLVLNKVDREMPVMTAIRDSILANACNAVVQVTPFDGSFMRAARKFRPDVILIFPMHSVGVAQLLYLLKLSFGCRIVCLRAEGVFNPNIPTNVAAHVGYDRYGKHLIDAELFWGRNSASVIGAALVQQDKLSGLERVKYFGYPRLESSFKKFDPEQCRFARSFPIINSFNRAHTVFVVTGFHFANYTKAEVLGAGDLDAENRLPYLLALIEKVKAFRQQWISAIMNGAQKHRDVLFVVKKHPIENSADYSAMSKEPNILLLGDELEPRDVVNRAGLLIHYGSTVSADAYLAGIPTVYVYSRDAELQEWCSDLGWPASMSMPIDDLQVAIDKFVAGGIDVGDQSLIQDVLEGNFNIRRGLAYTPSKDIAQFLLTNEPAQRVPPWDKYLWLSLIWYFKVKVRQVWAAVFAGAARAVSPS